MSDLGIDPKNPDDHYGDTHDWVRGYTHQWGAVGGIAYTLWSCNTCSAQFTHYYHNTPNIRDAMREAHVVDQCPKKGDSE